MFFTYRMYDTVDNLYPNINIRMKNHYVINDFLIYNNIWLKNGMLIMIN